MISKRIWQLQHRIAPYAFVSPFVILFGIFLLYPLVRSFLLSFCSTMGAQNVHFNGVTNYKHLLVDPLFWAAVMNTVIYVVGYLSIQIPAALGLALLLNNPSVRGRNFFRFAFYSTHLVGQVFVAVVFMQMLDPRRGLVTKLVMAITGSHYIGWLSDPVLARLAVIIAWLWLSIGYGMVYFLAALQGVDKTLYEAAEVDGAGPWRKFWNVTFPGIRPVFIFLTLIGVVGSFQLFELPFVLLQGSGPKYAGLTIVFYLFGTGFQTGNLGYASTIGWALVFIIFCASSIQYLLTREKGK